MENRLVSVLPDEIELVSSCQKGDLEAFRVIYNFYRTPLYLFAYRMLQSREDAEDALQTTFLKLFKSIRNFRFHSKFSSYLFKILINVCHDIREKRSQRGTKPAHYPEKGKSDSRELQIMLNEAIRQLPEKMRECFILFSIEGFSQEEISLTLGIRVGTVKAHIFQAKTKLKQLLGLSIFGESNEL